MKKQTTNFVTTLRTNDGIGVEGPCEIYHLDYVKGAARILIRAEEDVTILKGLNKDKPNRNKKEDQSC